MKGFMRQRGASWELRVYLGLDPVTGKKRYATKTVRGGKRAAQTALAEMITEAERGMMARTTATVGELLDAWFDFAAPDFSPKTVKETRGYIDRSLMPSLGSRQLAKLKPADLDAFYRRLLASGGAGGRPLAPATVRRIHGILRRALNQGVKWGWLGINPATATTPPRVPVSDIAPPSADDLSRVLRRAESESPDLSCYLVLAAATGARRSELIALRWSDVNLDRATVSIERGIVNGPNGLVEKGTKTHSARRVSLDVGTASVLAEHRERVAHRAAACRVSIAPDAFVFSNTVDGTAPWFPDSVSRSFKRLCATEGVPDVRLHDLRHFVATQLLSAGVDVRTVAGRLGHRNAATTLNVYAHFVEQSDREAADIIGNVLDSNE
ncbi:MAG: site-specific integrase [Actinomycetota bacterium]